MLNQHLKQSVLQAILESMVTCCGLCLIVSKQIRYECKLIRVLPEVRHRLPEHFGDDLVIAFVDSDVLTKRRL